MPLAMTGGAGATWTNPRTNSKVSALMHGCSGLGRLFDPRVRYGNGIAEHLPDTAAFKAAP